MTPRDPLGYLSPGVPPGYLPGPPLVRRPPECTLAELLVTHSVGPKEPPKVGRQDRRFWAHAVFNEHPRVPPQGTPRVWGSPGGPLQGSDFVTRGFRAVAISPGGIPVFGVIQGSVQSSICLSIESVQSRMMRG